jgi:ADP-ribosyl-[dinitrogen reductase] hydrolase
MASLAPLERNGWERLDHIEAISEQDISSSGYTVSTVEAAVWSFLTTDSFEAAIIRAANLGDDADTVAAVTGALAGAYYGNSDIPPRWKESLWNEPEISDLALKLAGQQSNINPD